MLYFEAMNMLLPPGGNSPERRNSYIPEASTEGVSTIKDKVLAIQREIGVKACDFVSKISYQDPFNLLFDGLYREITKKAILKSAGSVDLSDVLLPKYSVARAIEQDFLISQFVSSYRQDPDFRSGVSAVTDTVSKLKPFIQGYFNFALNPSNGFVADSTVYPHSTLAPYLETDPSGSLVITYLGEKMQSYGNRLSTLSRVAGLAFGVNQFVAADVAFTMQKLPEIEQFLHAVRFLKGTDTLIEKIGFGPSPFS